MALPPAQQPVLPFRRGGSEYDSPRYEIPTFSISRRRQPACHLPMSIFRIRQGRKCVNSLPPRSRTRLGKSPEHFSSRKKSSTVLEAKENFQKAPLRLQKPKVSSSSSAYPSCLPKSGMGTRLRAHFRSPPFSYPRKSPSAGCT